MKKEIRTVVYDESLRIIFLPRNTEKPRHGHFIKSVFYGVG